MTSTTIARIEAIPVTDPLRPEERYGSARGLVSARSATLVRLETKDGAVGWGEGWGASRASTILIDELAQTLVDTPLEPSGPWLSESFQRGYHHTTGGPHIAAASAVDIAMWDAFGKTLGVSVQRLLGGRARTHLTPYASAGYITPNNHIDTFSARLREIVAEGFTGVKIKLGLGAARDAERVAVARDVLGPQGALFVDFNGNYTADQALRSINAIQAYDLGWVEEPVPPDDRRGWQMLRGCGVPLAAGEAIYTRYGFRDLIAERVLDIVQPDVSKCGGLGEARVIAHLAQTWNVRFSPHSWGGVVSQAATLQLLGAVPDYPHTDHVPEPLWLELDRGRNALREELATQPFNPVGGYIEIPDVPGLGVEIDEKALARLRSDR